MTYHGLSSSSEIQFLTRNCSCWIIPILTAVGGRQGCYPHQGTILTLIQVSKIIAINIKSSAVNSVELNYPPPDMDWQEQTWKRWESGSKGSGASCCRCFTSPEAATRAPSSPTFSPGTQFQSSGRWLASFPPRGDPIEVLFALTMLDSCRNLHSLTEVDLHILEELC